MKNNCKPPINKQLGVSLIGLMVGLLVSMVAILGSLSLYRNLTQVSVDAVFDANHNSNAAASMLRIQIELQEAGFGLTKPDATAIPTETQHLILIPNPTNGALAQEIRWRKKSIPTPPGSTATTVTCSRVIERNATAANLPNGNSDLSGKELILQTANSTTTANCSELAALTSIAEADWTTTELLGVSVVNRLDTDFSRTAANTHIFNFSLRLDVDCSPFGMMPDNKLTMVNIQYATSVNLNTETLTQAGNGNNNTRRDVSYNLCIANPVS